MRCVAHAHRSCFGQVERRILNCGAVVVLVVVLVAALVAALVVTVAVSHTSGSNIESSFIVRVGEWWRWREP